MRISDWSSDVCSSDLVVAGKPRHQGAAVVAQTDADVAVEQTVAVAVFGDQEQAAVAVAAGGGRGAGAAAGAGEEVFDAGVEGTGALRRSEEHTSELQSLKRTSSAVFCVKKKKK